MSKRYYKHTGASQKKKFTRLLGLLLILTGVLITGYVFLPLISWQIYFAPVFASQNIASPIPPNNHCFEHYFSNAFGTSFQ